LPKRETTEWTLDRNRWLSCGLVLALAGCGGSAVPEWKTFHDANAGFSADFPGDVNVPQHISKSGTGESQNYRFECRPKNASLTFEVSFVAQSNTDEQIAANLESVENRKLDHTSGYTSSETKRIQLGIIPGVEHVLVKDAADRGKSFRRYRVYSVHRGDFTVVVDSVTTADA
jgi:hypothetical protein